MQPEMAFENSAGEARSQVETFRLFVVEGTIFVVRSPHRRTARRFGPNLKELAQVTSDLRGASLGNE
jgi:hypothetical protein